MGSIAPPTTVRLMTQPEWEIVTDVYTSRTLPFRQRIFITNALGAGGAPFTIPTSLITAVFTVGVVGWVTKNPLLMAIVAVPSFIASATNVGYLMNVGNHANGDMATSNPALLVHETGHVWQGRNSIFALSYVISSVVSQCAGVAGSSGSRGAAYRYISGQPWGSYNAEQQASIIEDWYLAGQPQSGDLWDRYIRDYVRRGRTS